MKQFQLQQVKFPKPHPQSEPNVPVPQPIRKPTAQSQMIRIIIALMIAIFVYNSSQQTTINYNEIIKNQKMFLVKNIRGVIPTLSGDVHKLQDYWKVVHFENYKQNHSELFSNFTLLFNATNLLVENQYCNTKLVYDWKNYSYNIDFQLISDNTRPMTMNNLELNSSVNQVNLNQPGRNLQDALQGSLSYSSGVSDTQKNPNDISEETANEQPAMILTKEGTSTKLSEQQKKCTESINYFKEVILFTSVWTISSKNLYLLMENANIDEDFYMILKPVN